MKHLFTNTILFIGLFLISTAVSAKKPAYEIFNPKGKSSKYSKLLKEAQKADIILFGELHNNPISHWLQLELAKDLHSLFGDSLILGAEMFESDNALLLQEYVSGAIRTRNFEAEAKLWPNYKTDIKPLVEFARENKLDFIATNVPRRYAATVNFGGFEALEELSNEAKSLIPPLPVAFDPELPQYMKIAEMMGGGQMGDHANSNIVKAQALKDATMAHFILENFEPGKVFLHFHGSFHSDFYEGIMWYLLQQNPDLTILTIASTELDDDGNLPEDKIGAADFIIATPASMTKTH
jgi:uncharacterized iron-regulated protein